MVIYEADITPLSGSVVDGDVRRIAKVTLMRFDKPTGKGVKAGTTVVRAWTHPGLMRVARQAVDDLKRRDMARCRDDLIRRIERIEGAQRVDLTKRVSLRKKGK